ncbi:hypothetical protein GH714_014775 [Hevea brasiliensis]|uniref:non-specific serine/threonine protein kinase n=1 Tax=Hevea brasiliensis TaxID=3981 RepID=A0A6A6M0L0_HEVBR|nr:hypothetical protein GH714_014775 [Hevea brasiliensis]
MLFKAVLLVSLLVCLAASEDLSFLYNGFRSANLSLDGTAEITYSGLLRLTNHTRQQKGHAFFPHPITFKNSNGSVFTFSTTFVFAIVPQIASVIGQGIAFVIAPTKGLPGSFAGQYLGLFNDTNNEVLEDWELDYGPHRFKYKDLYIATKGFRDKELLGSGGFGRVYRGVLPSSKIEIAVKKVSHETRQGMKVFVAEIVSIGRLRHRNLVTLLGYCRREGELLLVYDYMPNGSLDKYLYDQPRVTLNWSQRFKVIKGVASGLYYLHEEWEQVVIHRDVKASNVLLDGELNGRLGDFGLARLYDHGTDPQTTHIAGTLGYLAPEHTRTGKATTKSDVGEILEARDPNLGPNYTPEEVELVLKLGLLCSHAVPEARPSMRQVLQFLECDIPLPELSSLGLSASGLTFARPEGFSEFP